MMNCRFIVCPALHELALHIWNVTNLYFNQGKDKSVVDDSLICSMVLFLSIHFPFFIFPPSSTTVGCLLSSRRIPTYTVRMYDIRDDRTARPRFEVRRSRRSRRHPATVYMAATTREAQSRLPRSTYESRGPVRLPDVTVSTIIG